MLTGISVVLHLDLKRVKNHNKTTLLELLKALKTIEEADEFERRFKEKNNRDKNYNMISDRSRTTVNSNNKPCIKLRYEHKSIDYLDNRYGRKYQCRKNHTNVRIIKR